MSPARGATTIEDLVRILGQVVTGDFHEKPPVEDDPSDVGLLSLLVRFVIDDLEAASKAPHYMGTRDEALRFKQRFINNAAHELNTPLTPIRMQMKILRKALEAGRLDDELAKAVTIADRNLTRLVLLLEELFAVSNLDDGGPPRTEPLDLDALVHACLSEFQDAAESHTLSVVFDSGGSAIVPGDPAMLRQAVHHLLANAIRFTPDGGTVHVQLQDVGDAVMLQVQDTGSGFDPADAKHMFEPFQANRRGTDGELGAGVSLYATKGIVERHGGLLMCDSPGVGYGSTFCMALPTGRKIGGADAARSDVAP